MTRTLLCAALFPLLGGPAFAEGTFTVGALITSEQNPYVGATDDATLVPYLSYETDRLQIATDGLSYDVYSTAPLTFALTLSPRFGPDLPNTALFEGLNRSTAIEAGIETEFNYGNAYAQIDLRGDVSDTHDGAQAKITFGYEWDLDRVMFDVSAGARFRDANLNNHLFGVSAAEATATRAAYDAGDTTTAFAQVEMLYAFSDTVFGVVQVSYEDLGDNTNSPLVARQDKFGLALGVAYQF